MNEKKGFLLYHDSYTYILTLPMEQRGELFTALYHYSIQSEAKGPPDAIVFAAQCTGMWPETKMAFYFMAGNSARDYVKWKTKQANYSAAATKRYKERAAASMPFRGRGVDVYPETEELTEM